MATISWGSGEARGDGVAERRGMRDNLNNIVH